jgi:DNA repair exonuclease SbcCD nuclease subunit
VVVYGNHDRPGDLEYLSYLRTDFPIQVVSRALIANPVDGISVACIPWPRKAWLAGKLAPDVDVGEEAIRALGSILTGFEASFAKLPGHHVLLAHAEIGAAKLDSGQPVAGHADVELSLDDMHRTGAEYIALGHIHKRQTIRDKVCYAGSPRQTTFGQDTDKGYVLFDLSNGELQYIDAPGRRLHTAELSWDGGELRGDTVDLESGQTLVGQSVRIRYTVDSSEAAMAMAEAEKLREKMLAQGAHAVKLEPTVNTTHRVRSEEIQYASTNADRIRAWWSSRNETPARSEHIIAKLGELEVPV